MSIKQNESAEIQSLLYKLEGELHVLIKREHVEIRDELSQMGSVVSDAIKTLMQSLNSLNVHLKEQNELVRKISTGTDRAENKLRYHEYEALSKMIGQNITDVVRSFQFEDIVQQLVSHCRTRSDGLELLVDQLNQNVGNLKEATQDSAQQIVSVMMTDIAEARKKLEKENPVKQTSMGAGGIELF